jgi:hypothetical protein
MNSMANESSIIKRNDNIVWRMIDGEIVLLRPDADELHALGGCGGRIWELLENEISVSEIVDVICEEYEVEPETAKKDVIDFVEELDKLHLAHIVSGVSEEAGR